MHSNSCNHTNRMLQHLRESETSTKQGWGAYSISAALTYECLYPLNVIQHTILVSSYHTRQYLLETGPAEPLKQAVSLPHLVRVTYRYYPRRNFAPPHAPFEQWQRLTDRQLTQHKAAKSSTKVAKERNEIRTYKQQKKAVKGKIHIQIIIKLVEMQ